MADEWTRKLSDTILRCLAEGTAPSHKECMGAIFFSLGRLLSRKEPDLSQLRTLLDVFLEERAIPGIMEGASYQVEVGFGPSGELIVEKGGSS
jgi:hypothetical protein